MGAIEAFKDFIKQSERVLMVTHKPRENEYRQMAITTGIGMVLIGFVGFIISMIALVLRGG